MGAGGQRFDPAQVDLDGAGIRGAGVGFQGDPVASTTLGFEKAPRHVVAGEDGGRDAAFRSHVGDGGPFRHGQSCDAGAAVLEDDPHVSLGRQEFQDVKDDVLCGHPGLESPREMDADDPWRLEIKRLAGHGQGYVQAPAPMASMPRAPQVGEWLSAPMRVLPGLPKRSRWT